MSTLTITLTDADTGTTVTGTADFTVNGVSVSQPNDQLASVGTPV